jgi:hypothetical protein
MGWIPLRRWIDVTMVEMRAEKKHKAYVSCVVI